MSRATAAEPTSNGQTGCTPAKLCEIVRHMNVLEMYEMLRPRRCNFEEHQAPARRLREEFNAPTTAAFVEEAATVYRARGLLRREID